MFIKGCIFYYSDETEIRFHFYRSFSTFWNISGGLYTQVFHSWAWVRSDIKSSVS